MSFKNSTSGGVVCPNLPIKPKTGNTAVYRCHKYSFIAEMTALILPPPLRPLPSKVKDTSGLPTGTKDPICTLSSNYEG